MSVAVAPDAMLAPEVDTTEVVVEGGPEATLIVGSVEVTGVPPIVAPMVVGVPAAAPVNVAV